MLDRDLLSHVAREALLKARRDKSARDLEMLRAQQTYLVDQIQQRRHAEAEQAQAEARYGRAAPTPTGAGPTQLHPL